MGSWLDSNDISLLNYEVVENDRSGIESCGLNHIRVQRGDMGPLILHILQEKAQHGYEIIGTLEQRSHGLWRPSAGSIYPTLQLLEEQGLISGEDVGGKKTYTLTEQGRAEAKNYKAKSPWGQGGGTDFKEIGMVCREIFLLLRQIARSGSTPKLEKARQQLHEFRDMLTEIATSKNL
jgi:DNA-binding PadR family transcriptional regulator